MRDTPDTATTAVTSADDTDHDIARRFTRRLYAAAQAREPGFMALRRWRPGTLDTDIIQITAAGNDDQWPYLAAAGAAVARYGYTSGERGWGSIGRALRRAGTSNARTSDALNRLVRANTLDDLHTALCGAAATLRAASTPPSWEQLVADVLDWSDPHHRDTVRTRWSRDFYTYTPTCGATRTDTPTSKDN